MATTGHAFAPDTPWQRELEDAFAYVETPDQLSSIDEVKADMEREVPMDRLICGDVGYGKTEIAVRAAFKAVQDGKQVAVLVPDHPARAAAPADLHRALRPVPRDGQGAQPLPE
jgi:transcription-repair coupling factor (superfamily II helicase)